MSGNMRVFDDKQPSEAYYVQFDFTEAVDTDTISSATVTAVDESGTDVTTTIITAAKQTITSPSVYVWVKGGTSGTVYTITCIITSSSGEIYELDAQLPVESVTY
jgi:NADPH-dependent ferric siderophore reductase